MESESVIVTEPGILYYKVACTSSGEFHQGLATVPDKFQVRKTNLGTYNKVQVQQARYRYTLKYQDTTGNIQVPETRSRLSKYKKSPRYTRQCLGTPDKA